MYIKVATHQASLEISSQDALSTGRFGKVIGMIQQKKGSRRPVKAI